MYFLLNICELTFFYVLKLIMNRLFDTDLVTVSEDSPDFIRPFLLTNFANSADNYHNNVSDI